MLEIDLLGQLGELSKVRSDMNIVLLEEEYKVFLGEDDVVLLRQASCLQEDRRRASS